MTNQQYNVEELISRNDLLAFAERAGANFKKTGGEFRSHCPLHGGKNGSGLAVWMGSDGKQRWKCFTDTCGQGDVIDWVMVWQHKDFKGAVEFLGGEIISDPAEMTRLAEARAERARVDREKAQAVEKARLIELQAEQKHLLYHNSMNDYFVSEWNRRGLNECWQGFWTLGGCSDFVVNGDWHTPTLTIPIVDEHYEVLNIKHRLLNPPKPGDKYRPEKPGLGRFPYFLAYPDLGYDKGEIYWILEGEIKAAVAATITPESNWQFIGVPGKSQYGELVGKLNGKNVIVVPDPDAGKETAEFCRAVNGRYIRLPEKADDMIVEYSYDADWLRGIERQARRLK